MSEKGAEGNKILATDAASSSLKLKFSRLPRYIYQNQPFDVEVYLLSGDNLFCDMEIPLSCELLIEEDASEMVDIDPHDNLSAAPSDCYKIFPSQVMIDRTGVAKLSLTLSELSVSHGSRKVYIAVQIPDNYILPIHLQPLRAARPTISTGFMSVRYQLTIQPDVDNPVPEVWYKDEGGKENRIDLKINLIGPNGDLVLNHPVPLKLTLTYASGEHVINQDLLQLAPDSKLIVDESGRALVRVRINDISKNHQKQLFCVMVSPDCTNAPLLNEISPAVTEPVEVKSKRGKRQRDTNSSTSLALVTAQPGGSNNHNNGANNKSWPTQQQHDIVVPGVPPVQGLVGNTTLDTSGSNSFGQINKGLNEINNSSEQNNNFAGEGTSLSDALLTVVEWISRALTTIHESRWRVMGYERTLGSNAPNMSRPIYDMPNPTVPFDNLCAQYSGRVHAPLTFLYSTLTQPTALATQVSLELARNGIHPYVNGASSSKSINSPAIDVSQSIYSSDINLDSTSDAPTSSGDKSLAEKRFRLQNSNAVDVLTASSSSVSQQQNSQHSTQIRFGNSISTHTPTPVPEVRAVTTSGSGSSTDPNWSSAMVEWQIMFGSEPASQVRIELTTEFISGRPYAQGERLLGFPAFNGQKQLIGFFRESKDSRDATTVDFVDCAAAGLTDQSRRALEYEAANENLANSGNVHAHQPLHKLSDHHGDLERLKQEVLVGYWLAEVDLDMGDYFE